MDQWARQDNINKAKDFISNWFQVGRDLAQLKIDAVTNAQMEWNKAWTQHDKPDFNTELCYTLLFAALAFIPGAAYTAVIGCAAVRELAIATKVMEIGAIRGEGFIMVNEKISDFFTSYKKMSDQWTKYKDLLSLGADIGRNTVTRLQSTSNLMRGQRPSQGNAGLSAYDASMLMKDQLGSEKSYLTSQEGAWNTLVTECMGQLVQEVASNTPAPQVPYAPAVPTPLAVLTLTPEVVSRRLGPTSQLQTSLSDLADQFEKQLWMTYVASNVVLAPDRQSFAKGMEMAQFQHILEKQKMKPYIWRINQVQDLISWGAQVANPLDGLPDLRHEPFYIP